MTKNAHFWVPLFTCICWNCYFATIWLQTLSTVRGTVMFVVYTGTFWARLILGEGLPMLLRVGVLVTFQSRSLCQSLWCIFGNNYPITGYYSTELNYNVEVTVLSQQEKNEKIIFLNSRGRTSREQKNLFDNRWYAHPVQFIQT